MQICLPGGEFAIVDDDQAHLAVYKWSVANVSTSNRKPKIYVHRAVQKNGAWTTEYMHRVVLNAPDDQQVDHIDGDGLNNRRGNLRLVTHAQNMQNRGPQRNNRTGIRGVFWVARGQHFEARVNLDHRLVFRRTFRTLEEASLAVTDARRRFMPFSAEARD